MLYLILDIGVFFIGSAVSGVYTLGKYLLGSKSPIEKKLDQLIQENIELRKAIEDLKKTN